MLKVIMTIALCVIAFALWNEYAPCALVPWNHERFVCEAERWAEAKEAEEAAYKKAHHGKGRPSPIDELRKALTPQKRIAPADDGESADGLNSQRESK
jgi:hypothetical protein